MAEDEQLRPLAVEASNHLVRRVRESPDQGGPAFQILFRAVEAAWWDSRRYGEDPPAELHLLWVSMVQLKDGPITETQAVALHRLVQIVLHHPPPSPDERREAEQIALLLWPDPHSESVRLGGPDG